jgi:hypothetical protein
MIFLLSMVEAAPLTQVWLGGALSGTVGPKAESSLGGGVMGEVGVSLGRDFQHSFGLQARARELYVTEDAREVGVIDLQIRYPSGVGPYVGLGFEHHHEATLDRFLGHAPGVIAGTDAGITHRSGFEVTGGWSFATIWPGQGFVERISPFLETSVGVMPDDHRPNVYVFLDLGIHVGVGKVKSD